MPFINATELNTETSNTCDCNSDLQYSSNQPNKGMIRNIKETSTPMGCESDKALSRLQSLKKKVSSRYRNILNTISGEVGSDQGSSKDRLTLITNSTRYQKGRRRGSRSGPTIALSDEHSKEDHRIDNLSFTEDTMAKEGYHLNRGSSSYSNCNSNIRHKSTRSGTSSELFDMIADSVGTSEQLALDWQDNSIEILNAMDLSSDDREYYQGYLENLDRENYALRESHASSCVNSSNNLRSSTLLNNKDEPYEHHHRRTELPSTNRNQLYRESGTSLGPDIIQDNLMAYPSGDQINGQFTAISRESIEEIIHHIFNIPNSVNLNEPGSQIRNQSPSINGQVSSIYFEMTIDILDGTGGR